MNLKHCVFVIVAGLAMPLLAGAAGNDSRAPSAAAGDSLQAQFDANGLTSLKYGGYDFLKSSQMTLEVVKLQPASDNEIADRTPKTSIFDPTRNRMLNTYSWGTIACAYHPGNNRLDMDFDVRAASASIKEFYLQVLHMRLPSTPSDVPWRERWHIWMNDSDSPKVIFGDWEKGSVAFCNLDVQRSAGIGVIPKDGSDYTLVLKFTGPPDMGPFITPAQPRRLSLSLRFGPGGTTGPLLGGDVYKKFVSAYPAQLHWKDRRPIGDVHLSTTDTGWPTNPRGWLMNPNVDTTTPSGLADFKQKMLACADTCVTVAKSLNAQGLIVWDIEGQEMPHALSYIGDPRMLPKMAPEMDAIADEIFKKFSTAGLRTGVTIRPTQLEPVERGRFPWDQVQVDDVVGVLSEKIKYAKKRWGCTIFYLDSNVRWAKNHDSSTVIGNMFSSTLQAVAKRHPDVLIIPEHCNMRDWGISAPYKETRQDFFDTPADAKALYPNAITVLRVVDGPPLTMTSVHDRLVTAVKNGDILLFRAWWNDPDNVSIKKILDDAAKR
jgi:hypothetical protein